jgi:predicted transglutaminase-like cysteine proteinase
MNLNKKIIISFCIFTIIFTCFSGCILEDIFGTASFSLDSYNIIDDQGFPTISIYFNCSGRVNLKTFDTSSNMVDYDFFYHEGNTTLNIGDYKETVKPGKYSFKVYDRTDKEIFNRELSFKGSNLSIINCEQQWWEDKNKYILIGLKIYVQNLGDIPVYPFYADMIVDSQTYTGDIVPSVVLPGFSNYIYFNFIHEGVFNNGSFEIVLKDKDNINLAIGSFNFNVKKNISTRYYSDDFLFTYYSNLDRIVVEDYSVFILDRYDNVYLDLILDKIIESYSNQEFYLNSDAEKIEYVNGFIQALDYKPDSDFNDSYEYPRYPIETLFNGNGGGDCEDMSILSASLLEKLGYEVALLRLPKHMAVGVKLDKDAVSRYNFYTDGYYFLETTNEGKPLGFIPKEYESPSELYIYPIKQTEFVTHNWKNGVITVYSKTESGDFIKVIAFIENFGNKTAENIWFKGLFYNTQELELMSESMVVDDISAFDKIKVILSVPKPSDLGTWFETRVIINGKIVDTQKSNDKFD